MKPEIEKDEDTRAAGGLVASVVMAVLLLIVATFVGQLPVTRAEAETPSARR